mmetsp:Transcript_97785/g.276597  ORF Transcript_97785/g.276597 Transcript_97785/m.276597 type:complete len:207 (-) Transcript_97785:3-623(-)
MGRRRETPTIVELFHRAAHSPPEALGLLLRIDLCVQRLRPPVPRIRAQLESHLVARPRLLQLRVVRQRAVQLLIERRRLKQTPSVPEARNGSDEGGFGFSAAPLHAAVAARLHRVLGSVFATLLQQVELHMIPCDQRAVHARVVVHVDEDVPLDALCDNEAPLVPEGFHRSPAALRRCAHPAAKGGRRLFKQARTSKQRLPPLSAT